MKGQVDVSQDASNAASPRKDLSAAYGRLKQRSEFLTVAKGARMHEAAFTLQARKRAEESGTGERRFGLTVTKKTGNSVERNRIRRRLREALRAATRTRGTMADGNACDYVIVARRECLSIDFADLTHKLDKTIDRIDRRLTQPPRS